MKRYIVIFLKGLAMGTADVVPGVSGGTIAFISGIYEEFINSLKSVNIEAFKILFTKGLKFFWLHINGNFLAALFFGIFVSILGVAKLITFLLMEYPILLWSFFFGLILASVVLIFKQIEKYDYKVILGLLIGTVISYYITIAFPSLGSKSYGFTFLYGFIAIIAMILPGISGSFILLLLGAYYHIIGTINTFGEGLSNMNIDKIISSGILLGIFTMGALIGMLTFSRILSWMFTKFKNITLALLNGFIIGSLNKVWPWKEVLQWRENSKGKVVPFLEESISPFAMENNYFIQAIILMLVGFFTIYLLQILSIKKIK